MTLRRPLHEGWTLEPVGPIAATGLFPPRPVAATVPGCVHTDLLAADIIADPFLDENEALVEWVAETDWRYRTTLRIDEDILAHDRVELCFDGLDTLATVTLDGSVIGSTANMHRRYRFGITPDPTGVFGAGDHELAVTFRSATAHCRAVREAEGDHWPAASFGRPYNYLRKMACSWGWDWGPWLTTAGIWRPVTLHAWSGARIDSVRPRVEVDRADAGRLSIDVDLIQADRTGPPGSEATPRPTPSEALVEATLHRYSPGDHHAIGRAVVSAQVPASGPTCTIDLDAGTVERWWPRSLGEPTRYHLEVRLLDADEAELDRWERPIGFRTVDLDTTPDELGAGFALHVNGVPIFTRGVNWIPDDVFPSRVTADRYRHRLGQAADAGVDLVRVWGGGIYEDDAFYDACDELGLLVWQDFAFACAAYPEHLLADEVEAEARDNIERLCPHPSLALWNGNNENQWGHADWGWQEHLDGRPWGAGFYFELLPRLVTELDPGRPYWPGSPASSSQARGRDTPSPNADAHGCSHIWDVWNQLDFERYRDHTPRFAAEFGWQAPPTWPTLTRAIGDPRLGSPALAAHQKAEDGDIKLARGLAAHVGAPDDIDRWWYGTQILQARALQTGIEHLRSLRGHCMGTIWWQLNDCWPVTSWALIDGDGRPKPAWYALRESYRDRLLTLQPRGDALAVVAVNDGASPWPASVTARRLGMDGTTLAAAELELAVPARDKAMAVLPPPVARPDDPAREVLVVEGADTEAWWWFAPDRQSVRPRPRLRVSADPATATASDPGHLVLALTSDVVVRDLIIAPDRLDPAAAIDRQVVSLLPGRPERFVIDGLGADRIDELLKPPNCWSVADLVPPDHRS